MGMTGNSNSSFPNAVKLRALWYEFASTGAIAAWTPVSRTGVGINTTAMRFTQDGASLVAPSWRAEYCTFWQGNGFGQEFWWSN